MFGRFVRGSVPIVSASMLLAAAFAARAGAPQQPAGAPTQAPTAKAPATPQPRPHAGPVEVDPKLVSVDDGDTVVIHWPGDDETVRILGIDSPETRHDEHKIPYDQPFGLEARAFAQGAFATATSIQLVRSATLDPYGRTLGYLIVNGRNYSVLIVQAKLAEESVSFYGDNGLPVLAAEVAAAAKAAGPVPFEPPHAFRKRMRTVAEAAVSVPAH